ncbi:protein DETOXIFICATION 52-like [Nymphaea colorata]|nr:protein DETOXIFICATION 52-like [Nymphaea colorata]
MASAVTFSLKGWWPIICLSLFTAVSVCLEWWFYELATFLSARLVDPKPKMAAMNVLMQAVGFLYTFPAALGSAAATRVGNELGAGRPRRALLAAVTAIAGSIAMAATSLTLAAKFARRWAEVFAPNALEVAALAAAAMPIVGLCELGNCPQMVGSGVLRGCARPSYGALINITAFYMVGAPVAVGLALFTGAGFIGIWLGLLAAQVCCAAVMMYAVCTIRWSEEARRSRELVHGRSDSPGDVEFIECLLTGDGTPSREKLQEFNRPESTLEEDSGDAAANESQPLIVDAHDRASSL